MEAGEIAGPVTNSNGGSTMERKTVILNTDPEPPETAEEQEPSEHDVFHKAFHVVLNQLKDS